MFRSVGILTLVVASGVLFSGCSGIQKGSENLREGIGVFVEEAKAWRETYEESKEGIDELKDELVTGIAAVKETASAIKEEYEGLKKHLDQKAEEKGEPLNPMEIGLYTAMFVLGGGSAAAGGMKVNKWRKKANGGTA